MRTRRGVEEQVRRDPADAVPTPEESWSRHEQVLDLIRQIRGARGKRRDEPAERRPTR
jgi:hypothetical protein